MQRPRLPAATLFSMSSSAASIPFYETSGACFSPAAGLAWAPPAEAGRGVSGCTMHMIAPRGRWLSYSSYPTQDMLGRACSGQARNPRGRGSGLGGTEVGGFCAVSRNSETGGCVVGLELGGCLQTSRFPARGRVMGDAVCFTPVLSVLSFIHSHPRGLRNP